MRSALLALLTALALGGCGGGGGGGGSGGGSISSNTSPPLPLSCSQLPLAEPHNTFEVDCDGANCGAIDGSTYSGSGVGAWRYTNTTSSPASVPVGISGTFGKDVTLVLTNQNCSGSIPLANVASPNRLTRSSTLGNGAAATESGNTSGVNRIPDRIRHFTPPALEPIDSAGPARSLRAPAQPAANVLGNSRNWYDHENIARTTYLEIQRTIGGGGRQINFWVQSGEYGGGRVSEAQLTALADAFTSGDDAIHGMVTGLAGPPWGSHPYGNLIPPSSTLPINVVLLNLTPDNRPFGLVGFFWGRDVYLRSTPNLDADSPIHYSNEALAFFLDTETLYRGPGGAIIESDEGLRFEISTLAHELVHMINFYQRFILRSTHTTDYGFDTWLEEMTALMMEDIVGLRLDPSYHVIRDDRFPTWLAAGDFNCDVTQFDDDVDSPCFGYNLTGSLGAWLLRHYGIDFYKALLTNTSSHDSVAVLDNAIRAAGGAGFKDAVRRWGTLLALLPAASSPPGFGLPARSEQGFTLPAIDGTAYTLLRRLPTTAPTALVPNGHFPQLRTNVGDSFIETVVVPPQTTLTVVVQ